MKEIMNETMTTLQRFQVECTVTIGWPGKGQSAVVSATLYLQRVPCVGELIWCNSHLEDDDGLFAKITQVVWKTDGSAVLDADFHDFTPDELDVIIQAMETAGWH